MVENPPILGVEDGHASCSRDFRPVIRVATKGAMTTIPQRVLTVAHEMQRCPVLPFFGAPVFPMAIEESENRGRQGWGSI